MYCSRHDESQRSKSQSQSEPATDILQQYRGCGAVWLLIAYAIAVGLNELMTEMSLMTQSPLKLHAVVTLVCLLICAAARRL